MLIMILITEKSNGNYKNVSFTTASTLEPTTSSLDPLVIPKFPLELLSILKSVFLLSNLIHLRENFKQNSESFLSP